MKSYSLVPLVRRALRCAFLFVLLFWALPLALSAQNPDRWVSFGEDEQRAVYLVSGTFRSAGTCPTVIT